MENLKYWVAFSKTEVSGSKFVNKLWRYFGCIKEAWFSASADLMQIEGLRQDTILKFIEKRKNVNPEQAYDEVLKKNINVITLDSQEYPYLLKEIYDPPSVLYIKGSFKKCNMDKTLAIVGSRKSSTYIADIIEKIINGLYGEDITIISGLALGVDTFAHKAALKNNLQTIAVLGCGLDNIYPASNKTLFKNIIDGNGAVISEYYPTERPETWKFPERNRIVSGLSKGCLIAEAGLKSGALITARLCTEQNRELMCIPGLVTNPNTEGTHKLIKEGAGLVTETKDIFEHLNWTPSKDLNLKNDNVKKIELLDNENKIYDILKLEPKQFDDILNESKLRLEEIMIVLTSLEIQGLIKQLPGQRYIRI